MTSKVLVASLMTFLKRGVRFARTCTMMIIPLMGFLFRLAAASMLVCMAGLRDWVGTQAALRGAKLLLALRCWTGEPSADSPCARLTRLGDSGTTGSSKPSAALADLADGP